MDLMAGGTDKFYKKRLGSQPDGTSKSESSSYCTRPGRQSESDASVGFSADRPAFRRVDGRQVPFLPGNNVSHRCRPYKTFPREKN